MQQIKQHQCGCLSQMQPQWQSTGGSGAIEWLKAQPAQASRASPCSQSYTWRWENEGRILAEEDLDKAIES